ncbi:MAG: argininosuccinate lyase [Trueperaceae bacterium]|nr:argininosuccinate lyase [Trueperaceae bacterium]
MSWHDSYCQHVLWPDYRFASQHLAEHFLDAMTAHVRTVARLPDRVVQTHQREIEGLEHALIALHDTPLPSYNADVPDLYFMFNRKLEAEVGEQAVGFLRLGLSRNDLDMTVYKMRARRFLLQLAASLLDLRSAVLQQAEAHVETILVAYTHHQPGQPTTVAHYLAAVDNTLSREFERMTEAYRRLNRCPLGAAALAGSSHPLDRSYTAQQLGFDGPVDNTYDAVASSDWQVELVGVAQNGALGLSRFVCDLIQWSSQGLFALPDSLVQGSSIMPQKRNPVALEHARTKLSRAVGSAQSILYSSHNIPYGDLNDFGPDIQGAFQALSVQLGGGLALLNACVGEGTFVRDTLEAMARATDTTATELADELVRQAGLSFPQAHKLSAALVEKMTNEGRRLQDATPADMLVLGGPQLSDAVLKEALEPHAFVRRRRGLGGPAPEVVSEHLVAARERLEHSRGWLEHQQHHLTRAQTQLRTPRKDLV